MNREEIIKKLKEKAAYEKEHKTEIMIDRLKNMKQFTDDYIPEPPITTPELYQKYVIPNFIRCGAIPKDKLIKGKTYFGSCRNADKAIWLGDKFEYIRTKFGDTFPETIKHFEEGAYSRFDVFVPIREINSE
jgi:hypothetical protein